MKSRQWLTQVPWSSVQVVDETVNKEFAADLANYDIDVDPAD